MQVDHSGLATVGLGVFFLSGTIIALLTVDRFNRLTILFYCLIAITVLCVVFTIMLSISGNQVLDYLSVIPLFGYMIFFNIGPGPIAWMIAGESVPPMYKAAVASLGSASLFLSTFIVGLVFPFLEDSVGQYSFFDFCRVQFS
jgi:SP family facilitated glucose transporter-like MFS transporter 1